MIATVAIPLSILGLAANPVGLAVAAAFGVESGHMLLCRYRWHCENPEQDYKLKDFIPTKEWLPTYASMRERAVYLREKTKSAVTDAGRVCYNCARCACECHKSAPKLTCTRQCLCAILYKFNGFATSKRKFPIGVLYRNPTPVPNANGIFVVKAALPISKNTAPLNCS